MRYVDIYAVEPTRAGRLFQLFIERDSMFANARKKAGRLFEWFKNGRSGGRQR